MRSVILTAAIVAALVSTSLTAGYAASSGRAGASSGRAGIHATLAENAPATRVANTTTTREENAARASAIRNREIAEGLITRTEQADSVPGVTINGCQETSIGTRVCR